MLVWLWVLVGGLFGLALGSFGNSVVYRLPRKMEQDWLEAAAEAVSPSSSLDEKETPLSSSNPVVGSTRSRCTSCHKVIAWYDNLPLISWLVLKGSCRQCKASIPFRYPLLEFLGALIGAASVWAFGPTVQAVAIGVAGLLILWLTTIDITHQLLPDSLVAPLAGIGLYAGSQGWFVSPVDALLGVLVGFAALAVPAVVYKAIRGFDGLGGGDALLLAALGAFIGPMAVMYAIVIAGVLGIFNSFVIKLGKFEESEQEAFAFGPWLMVGAISMFLFKQNALFW